MHVKVESHFGRANSNGTSSMTTGTRIERTSREEGKGNTKVTQKGGVTKITLLKNTSMYNTRTLTPIRHRGMYLI